MKKAMLIVSSISLAFGLAGCGGSGSKGDSGNASSPGNVSSEPVTLTFTSLDNEYQTNLFDPIVVPAVKKKFPNVTLQWVSTKTLEKFDQMVTAGQTPDITWAGYTKVLDLLDRNYPLDLSGFIKKYNLNLNVYDPAAMDTVKMAGPKGQIYGLPIQLNYYALFYNKDLFDKFAVAYPKDNMTWDDALALAKKLNKSNDQEKYNGMNVRPDANFVGWGLTLPLVDAKTNKASFNTDSWVKVFDLMKQVRDLNAANPNGSFGLNQFLEGKTAMDANFGALNTAGLDQAPFNWDVTTFPHFEGGKGMPSGAGQLYLSQTTKNQDIAYQVISYLTSDPDVGATLAKAGIPPAVKLSNLGQIFAQDLPAAKGKHIAGMFSEPYGPAPLQTKYDALAKTSLNKYMTSYLQGKISDVRTALSQAEEEANKAIADQMQK